MLKNIIIGGLVACLLWFGSAIIRLENQRYAYSLGMCDQFDVSLQFLQRQRCMAMVQTRSPRLVHLVYGLRIWPST